MASATLSVPDNDSISNSKNAPIPVKKYPYLRKVFPFCMILCFWYIYRIFILNNNQNVLESDMNSCNSDKDIHIVHSSGTIVTNSMVLVDSLMYDKLQTIGGTGHWFHLLERLLPAILIAAKQVWAPAYTSSRSNKLQKNHLYIVFRDAIGTTDLDSFGRLMMATILSGGYYDMVAIGYSTDIIVSKSPDQNITKYSRVRIKNFILTASMLYHPGEPMPYSEALGSLADHHQEEGQSVRAESSTSSSLNNICAIQRLAFEWNLAPKKRYDLFGRNRTAYDLLQGAVNRACGWEENVDVSEYGLYGRLKDPFAEFMKTIDPAFKELLVTKQQAAALKMNMGENTGVLSDPNAIPLLEDDSLSIKDAYGVPLEPLQIQAQLLQAAVGMSQDSIALPTSSRLRRKLRKFRESACNKDCNGTDSMMSAMNRADISVQGWSKYRSYHLQQAKKLIEDSIDSVEDNISIIAKVSKLTKTRNGHAFHNISEKIQNIDFVFPPVPIATDVPLQVLIYNRDKTRRLINAEAIAKYLEKHLYYANDQDRHAYFPLHYTDENAPRRLPKLGLGILGEVNSNKKRHAMRRKSGGYKYDTSHQLHYTHDKEKVNWDVDSITHNQHASHNEHVHVSGISGKSIHNNIHSGKSRYAIQEDMKINAEKEENGHELLQSVDNPRRRRRMNIRHEPSVAANTVTAHHPPCELIRSVKEATVLITPHGFQSILMIFQPLKSLFIEVMPFAYNKPEIYGFIQMGIRSIPRFGEYRSYLVYESNPTTKLSKALHWLGLNSERMIDEGQVNRESWLTWSQKRCTAWAICRHIVRQQDVCLDEGFMRHAADFIKTHFISNKNKH